MKKLFILFFCLVAVSPFYALAQDGSASTSDGSAVAVPSESIAAPRETPSSTTTGDTASVATTSAVGTTTSTPRPSGVVNPPAPAPLPSPPAGGPPPVATEPISTPPAAEVVLPASLPPAPQTPGVNLYLLLAAIPAVAAGAYLAKKFRSKQNTKEEESDKRCFDVRKLMEEKLNELTNLKGQLEGKAKREVRELAKETIKGTPAEDIVVKLERAEKEYGRLKKLFEKCVITAKAGKRVFIVHGWDGNPEEGWFPWAKKEFEKKGYKAYVPAMPESSKPKIDAWLSHLAEAIGTPDKNTYLVGHSIGAQAILRYLERLPKDEKIGGAIFVGGWFTPAKLVSEKEKQLINPWIGTAIDVEKVKQHCDKFYALFSDNDHMVPMDNKAMFELRLGAQTIVEHGKGHFSGADIKELPSVIEAIDTF
ncbi:MAG: alpha/beta hydrolase [bacterium]|nr:alpha/beta hydrolase [bacterium]